MLCTVIMRMRRTAICSKFWSQFRLITSEIRKAEQTHTASVHQWVMITLCLTLKKGMLNLCCLQQAISIVKNAKLNTALCLASEGRQGKGLMYERKKENYLPRICRNMDSYCLTQIFKVVHP